MDLNKNNKENTDEESNEFTGQSSRDKSQMKHPSKRSELSHKSQSRPNSRAASISHQSRTRSNSQTSKLWSNTNPFINFMFDFRKMQAGQTSTNIFRLGGERWRNMTEHEKQPFIDAANENKKLKRPQSEKNQKQNSIDKQKSKTSTKKDTVSKKKYNLSRKVISPKKRKRSQQRQETQLKKKRTKSATGTDTDTDTSGSIHTATTDCATEDSNESP